MSEESEIDIIRCENDKCDEMFTLENAVDIEWDDEVEGEIACPNCGYPQSP